jgi:hypothetical protein
MHLHYKHKLQFLFKEIVAVYTENDSKHIPKLVVKMLSYSNVTVDGTVGGSIAKQRIVYPRIASPWKRVYRAVA